MEKIDDFLLSILRDFYSESEVDSNNGVSSTTSTADSSTDSHNTNNATTAAAKFIMKSEETIISFLNTPDRMELEFPPLNSYYRRILHRLGRRYNLAHRVEASNIFNAASTLRKFYLTKPVGEDLLAEAPVLKCHEWIEAGVEFTGTVQEFQGLKSVKNKKNKSKESSSKSNKSSKSVDTSTAKPKLKILKRQTTDEPAVSALTTSSEPSACVSPTTLEELEAKYQAARERIFEGFTEADSVDADGLQSDSAVSDSLQPAEPQSLQITVTSPLNPDALPFDFTLSASTSIDHIYLITSPPTSPPLSTESLNQILSQFPAGCALIKTRLLPADSCFLLLKGDLQPNLQSTNCIIRKWEPEFYLD